MDKACQLELNGIFVAAIIITIATILVLAAVAARTIIDLVKTVLSSIIAKIEFAVAIIYLKSAAEITILKWWFTVANRLFEIRSITNECSKKS